MYEYACIIRRVIDGDTFLLQTSTSAFTPGSATCVSVFPMYPPRRKARQRANSGSVLGKN